MISADLAVACSVPCYVLVIGIVLYQLKEEEEEARDMWGDQFEESIKEKRKLFLAEGAAAASAATSQAGTPAQLSEQPPADAKPMSKTASSAALDMFAEHTDIFSDHFDVSFLFWLIGQCVSHSTALYSSYSIQSYTVAILYRITGSRYSYRIVSCRCSYRIVSCRCSYSIIRSRCS